MVCKLCGSTIYEYVIHERQNMQGPVLRRFECPCCGPLDYKTLFPLKGGDTQLLDLNKDEF